MADSKLEKHIYIYIYIYISAARLEINAIDTAKYCRGSASLVKMMYHPAERWQKPEKKTPR